MGQVSVPEHPYRPLIERVCQFYPPVPPDILEAVVIAESAGDPKARSASGARGLCQIIPRIHAATLGVKVADQMGVPLTDALWDDPEFSLRAGARHLAWLYTSDESPSWERAVRAYHSGSYDPPRGFVDGQGTSSDQHIAKFRQALSDVQALRSQQGTTTMATWSTVIPGLPGGPLTTNHPIFIKLIPASYTRQRPGIKAGFPRRSVQHGTGNPNSTARSEANYVTAIVANGAQVSYHSTTDDQETGVMVPADEVTWQAADGGGPGNMCGFSNELTENEAIWADPVRRYNMIDNAANFMGGIAAHLEIGVPEQHYTFNWADPNRHNCPNFLRNRTHNGRKAWDIYVDLWTAYKAEERARITGGAVVGKFKKGDRVKVVAGPDGYNRREGPGTSYAITGTFAGGTAGFTVIDGPRAGDGYLWYDLAGNGGTGFIVVDGLELDTTPQPVPVPAPVYAKPLPIPALLGTDLKKNDTAQGIVTDEANKFIFVADVIEVTAASLPVLQYAASGAPKLRADLVKGDRFVGAWLVTAADGKDYYVGCEPDWWRVPYDGTKRVADAPLLPGSERS